MSQDVSELIAGLKDKELATRRTAAEALLRRGPEASQAAVALVEACGDEDEQVREAVGAALEEIEPQEDSAAALAELLKHTNADVNYWAATLLGRTRTSNNEAIAALTQAVGDYTEVTVRRRAVWALGKIGPPARSAKETLRKAAASADAGLQRYAEKAMEAIGE